MSNPLTIISQNLWLHPHNLEKRMAQFLDRTFNPNPNPKAPSNPQILAIQELFSPVLRKSFTEKLEKLNYSVFHPNYVNHDYKIYAYLPSSFTFLLAAIFDLFLIKFLLYSLSVLLLPQVFKYLSIKFLIIPQDPYNRIVKEPNYNYDFMSELLAIKNEDFENFEVLAAKPFDTVGYPFPKYPNNKLKPKHKQCNEVQLFLEYLKILIFFYIQMVFMKPGYILVSCTHKKSQKKFIFGSCHCVINFQNPRRMYQVMELNKQVEHFQAIKKIDHVIISGDFNSFPNYIDMQYLKQQNFVDTFQIHEKNQEKQPENQKYTWHNKNPNTQVQDHLEKDAKIDFTLYKNFTEKKPLQTLESFVINNEPDTIISDHYGIYCKLGFAN